MNDLAELLKPRFVHVQFDTSKLKPTEIPDEEFNSELEDNDLPGADCTATFFMDNGGNTAGGGLDSLFVIDKKGGDQDNEKMQIDVPNDRKLIRTCLSDLRPSLYISSDAASAKAKMRDMNQQWAEDVLLKKSILKDESEKEKTIPIKRGKKAEKRHRQAEREKNAGHNWFGMAKPELTTERKRDLEVLKMRKVLDTKTFYKKNDIQQLPKYFEIGTVMDNATDFYSDRIPKKQRKQTLVDELLADEQFKKTNKRKYREALERQQYTSKKAYFQLKRIKKKEEAKLKKKMSI
ncbi:deoxynucleotidyltransferase terminal-interacting protein 2-like [Tropilaelaps mercedesae]|uniref:Deoxynucleotidyltransferase terminal-interacting protein 2-like n=1 Tax=Tropilaelaps mercedesae TaxID=418985 RepID=A0A1V9XZY8_9ACAR|nr:deoxynucleotidyltransferase terminal-interacting protein 2-like [Tropilaelaps mercedesae]